MQIAIAIVGGLAMLGLLVHGSATDEHMHVFSFVAVTVLTTTLFVLALVK